LSRAYILSFHKKQLPTIIAFYLGSGRVFLSRQKKDKSIFQSSIAGGQRQFCPNVEITAIKPDNYANFMPIRIMTLSNWHLVLNIDR
jgi:hypothetical protein